MRPASSLCAFSFLAVVLSVSTLLADDLQSFTKTYCVQCHGEQDPKGERRFDQTSLDVKNADQLIDLRDILDQLILGEMPPKEADQPPTELRQRLIERLTKTIESAQVDDDKASQTVLRRLNRREYLNTIRDLFGFDMAMFDPTSKFPRDQAVEHMDNIGEALVTSGFLLQQYLEAADAVVEKAFRTHQYPTEKSWTFNDNFKQQPEVDQAHGRAFDNRYLCLYECPNSEQPEGAFGPLLAFREGVPCDGDYEVRVLVEAKNRINRYDAKIMGVDPSEPLRMAIVPGNARLDRMHVAQAFHQPLAEVSLPDDGPNWYTFRVRLDAGFSPRFTFPNGMLSLRSAYAKLVGQHRNLLPESARKAEGIVANRIALFKHGEIPHIRIHEVAIRGPLPDSPELPASRLFGRQTLTDERVPDLLRAFADRAYRRPAEAHECAHLLRTYKKRLAENVSVEEAFQDALKAALCSPAFLYHQPIGSERSDNGSPSAHALATRLSYFLWSSMPDDELRRLADSGEIHKPEVLRKQVQRMLADKKSSTFVESFLDGWLNLRALGDMPPARDDFRRYYAHSLQPAMRRETFLFMQHLIDKNKSILDFLDADYSFINRSLAKLYDVDEQVPPEGGEQFRLVRFENPNRGGLLGQGSVLTVTANGIETSPVIRGVWLLENILGTPPSPPPEDVPPIDPDVRGAKSIRDLLVKHRESAACQECHRKIDPLGFALENFDPIGRWRTHYDKQVAIDSAGELPSGEAFRDLGELKKVLLQRREFFARMLTERLLTFACGRRLDPADRTAVDKICRPLAERNYPMRELIEEVVLCGVFNQK